MIYYRHTSGVIPPDLSDWEPRGTDVAMCLQRHGDYQIAAICEPILFQIHDEANWLPCGDGWEACGKRNAGGVTPSRDLARLKSWAPVMPVLDSCGEQWLAPVILTDDGTRAFPVPFTGPDFLPSPSVTQQRAMAIANEARDSIRQSINGSKHLPSNVACRWAAFLLSLTNHASCETIAAAGVLDDVLVRSILITASGLSDAKV